jgi:hypothetical protein
MSPITRRAVAQELLRYLVEHPAAADGVEGVRHWWLRGIREVSATIVREILEELAKRGWLVTRGETPETRIYAFNESEREAVVQFIAEPGDSLNG